MGTIHQLHGDRSGRAEAIRKAIKAGVPMREAVAANTKQWNRSGEDKAESAFPRGHTPTLLAIK